VWAHLEEPRIDVTYAANFSQPRMWVYGGGNLGFQLGKNDVIRKVDGKSDAFWSRDGITWHLTNYLEGGGTSVVEFFSSQEWTVANVDGAIKFLGVWGHTVELYKSMNPNLFQAFLFIAGDMTGPGGTRNLVFRSQEGIFCDRNNLICGGVGQCGYGRNSTDDVAPVYYGDHSTLGYQYMGCICPDEIKEDYINPEDGLIYRVTFSGEYCEGVNLLSEVVIVIPESSAGLILLILVIAGGTLGLAVAWNIYNK
jgi:hypothetical protein